MAHRRAHRGARVDSKLRAVSPSGATRTCIVTRRAHSPDSLLALTLIGDRVVAGRREGTRGAYVSVSAPALKALNVRSLSRAMRTSVKTFELDEFLDTTHRLAERKVLERIGLARGCGILRVGLDAARSAGAGAAVFQAETLSARSARQIEAMVFVDGEQLGSAAGMGWVGVLAIPPGQLADDASYWWRVWYETAGRTEAREDAG